MNQGGRRPWAPTSSNDYSIDDNIMKKIELTKNDENILLSPNRWFSH